MPAGETAVPAAPGLRAAAPTAAPDVAPCPRPWDASVDGPVAVVLALATLGARLAQASKTLYTVDSVLFSLGTERYDILSYRPHPPGYALFVAIGKALLPLAGHDANRAFVLESALWSAAAVGLLYALGRAWGSRRAAGAAAILFAVAPVFVLNGTIALSYTAEGAAMVGVALAAWWAWRRPSPATAMALGVAWALAVAIRPSLLLFLAPLVAAVLLAPFWAARAGPRRKESVQRVAWAAGACLAVTLAWFLPMLRATGGWAAWRHANRSQGQQVVFADALWARGWVAVQEHVTRLLYFLHWETGLAFLCLVTAVLGWVVRHRWQAAFVAPAWPRTAGPFILAWLGPALVFYLVVFDGWERGPLGYVLTLLPGLYLVGILLADHGLRRLAAAQPPRLFPLVRVLAFVVLLVPVPGLLHDAKALVHEQAEAHDEWTKEWQQVASAYPPNETAILTWQSWAHVQWYFPDHLAWVYFPSYSVPGQPTWALVFSMQHHEQEAPFVTMYEQGAARTTTVTHPIPPWVKTIVLFDFQLAGENGQARRLDPALNVTDAHLPDGWRILLVHPDASHPTVESLFTREALAEGAR